MTQDQLTWRRSPDLRVRAVFNRALPIALAKTMSRSLVTAIFLFCALAVPAAQKSKAPDMDNSVVQIEVSRRQYDFVQPWSRRVDQLQKVGTVLGPREILTTAEYLADITLLRLQKGGRGKWYQGEVEWVDFHANLAIVTCKDENFWKGLKPVHIAESTPRNGEAQLARWRNGVMETRNLDISRFIVKRGKLTNIDLLFLEVNSDVPGTGWAEPILQNDKLIGITSSKEERAATVIPSSFIKQCLDERKNWKGLGYFAFVWEPAENPATLEHLKLPGDPRGVIVIETPTNQVTELKLHDVITEIDGFAIDQKGDYKDPQHGPLNLECLSTRKHWAGEEIKLKIWRGDKFIDVKYKLPKVDYNTEVVPDYVFNKEPEYVLLGGLIFQPLTGPYLQSWGAADWQRRAPFRLTYLAKKKATPDMPSAVVLSQILPDKFNLGYQDARYLVVESMNGQKIRTIQDIAEARKHPKDGFHEVVFEQGDSLSRIILDANEADDATRRTMERYSITDPERIEK
jgi:hypothetical protein